MNPSPTAFPPTRWSVVHRAKSSDASTARNALELLCSSYWAPVHRTIQRRGYDAETAADLTQAFFLRLLERGHLQGVEAPRGRLRAYLRTSVRHFLIGEHERASAARRGGAVAHHPTGQAGLDPHADPLAHVASKESTVDHGTWIERLVEAALDDVRCRAKRRSLSNVFDAVRPALTGDRPLTSYADLARSIGTNEGAIRAQVYRLRSAFRQALRARIAGAVRTGAVEAQRFEDLALLWSDEYE